MNSWTPTYNNMVFVGLLPPNSSRMLEFSATNQNSQQCIDITTLDDIIVELDSSFNFLINLDNEDIRILVEPSSTAVTVVDNDRKLDRTT